MKVDKYNIMLGNWIEDENGPYRVDEELFETFELTQTWPIPITGKWFDKLNDEEFEFVGFGTRLIYQCKKYPAIKYEFDGKSVFVYFNDKLINTKTFVHEWQNIHMVLTNEKLILDK